MRQVPPQQAAAREGVTTPLEDLVQRALDKMGSGEWRLILEHPNPAQGTSVACVEVGQEIARRAADLTRLNAKVEELAATITQLQKWIDLHRGDTLSLENEVETMRRHWLEEEARSADLSARLARAVEVMRDTVAVWETCTGGYSYTPVQIERLRAARAFLSEQENPHG